MRSMRLITEVSVVARNSPQCYVGFARSVPPNRTNRGRDITLELYLAGENVRWRFERHHGRSAPVAFEIRSAATGHYAASVASANSLSTFHIGESRQFTNLNGHLRRLKTNII
jgi:hypothetical protein